MSLKEIVKKDYIENDNTLYFKTTSLKKVAILSIVTFGFYDIILAFNYWKSLKNNFGYKVSPFWRGIFLEFSNFELFQIFAKYFANFNIKLTYANILAILYLILTWIGNKIDFKVASLDTTNWTLEIISLIFTIITTLIFVLIQSKINKINEQFYPNAQKNPWKISNTIWLIICLGLWILAYLP